MAAPPDFAEVALPLPLDHPLTYALPAELRDVAFPGKRALVPLGRRWVTGMIVGVGASAPAGQVRPIREILDPEPILDGHLLDLTRWVAEGYLCGWGEAIRAALPPGIDVWSQQVASLSVPTSQVPPLVVAAMDPGERAAFDALAAGPQPLRGLERRHGREAVRRLLGSLREHGLAEVRSVLQAPRVRPRREGVYALTDEARAREILPLLKRRSRRQAALVEALLERPRLGAAEVVLLAGPDAARSLVAKDLVRREERIVPRDPLAGSAVGETPSPPLTPAQERAVAAIAAAARAGGGAAFLLYGVTGSGKTEVYLRAIAEVLGLGRQALALVPEIALTPLLVTRFRARFGSRVAVLHSHLSPGERLDQWLRIRRGEAEIVVGARSAVFAPLPRLGIIVVDEEHDPSYKQGEVPRYQGRDVALERARRLGIPVILGSATPALESYFLAREGAYRLLRLPERIEARPLPRVELVDMRRQGRAGRPYLSPPLRDRIRECLARGEQALLFLNRRGYATLVLCQDCGFALTCPRCSVSLTYHAPSRRVRCHYCDFQRRPPDICPQCQGATVGLLGFGTQRVEADLGTLFPRARIARMDRDTTMARGAHGAILGRVDRREVDILVGTQMVGKGHDFPGVTLVGVLSADQSLHLPDFRAAERTFALLTQVAGRAGRGARQGEAWIQTYNPWHYCLQAVAGQDYEALWQAEIAIRRTHRLPPFSRLALVVVSSPDEGKARAVGLRLGRLLSRAGPGVLRVDGPAPAPLARLRGRSRWQVLVRGDDADRLRQALRATLRALGRDPAARGATWEVDVDPAALC